MKKNVLHLLASNSYSGAENVVCTIIDNCSDEYNMYYCSPDGPIRDILEKRNINFIPLKRLSIFELKKIKSEYNIDIIHAHDYKASFISVFLNKKIISHIHCDYNLLWCSFLIGPIYSLIQSKFNKIIVVSKEILDNASFRNKILNKTIVINNVVDKEDIVKKSLEFESALYDLIFVGRLEDVKNPQAFIEIIKKLKENNQGIKGCIIGKGSLEEKCRNLIINYNLQDNIDMLGFKNNPFPYIKNSKIMIIPSKYEGFGLVAIESMILGTIVLNSGVGGLKSIFHKYEKYIMNDLEDYVSNIKILLNNDKKKYKIECDNIIKDYVDINRFKNNFIKIYDGLFCNYEEK